MDLIGVAVLLVVAVVGMLVLFFDALGRVLVGAVAALARAPWRALTRRRGAAGRPVKREAGEEPAGAESVSPRLGHFSF